MILGPTVFFCVCARSFHFTNKEQIVNWSNLVVSSHQVYRVETNLQYRQRTQM
jgi:hypothetical protein